VTVEGQTFEGTSLSWVVVNGRRGAVEASGTYGGQPATARVQLTDGATTGTADRFRATVTSGGISHDTGDVEVTAGGVTLS
jgi:hypothetical protein